MLVLTFCVSGCKTRNEKLREQAIDALGQSNLIAVRADVATLVAANTNQSSVLSIPEPQWPASFAVFNPVGVIKFEEGIYIQTSKFVSKSTGVAIYLPGESAPESSSGSYIYEELTNGVYWVLGGG